jgi:hypothetical protein
LVLPGIKIERPHEVLKPKELDYIRLVIAYKNEKGKKIYTKFTRINGIESNMICKIKPFFFRSLVK